MARPWRAEQEDSVNRRDFLRSAPLAAPALAASAQAPGSSARKPVYVLLHSRFTDHVNMRYTLWTFMNWMPKLERMRREKGGEDLSWLLEFTGAMSDSFAAYNRDPKLVEQTLKAVRGGYAEVGYNGYDEPAPLWKPKPNLRAARTPEERWLAHMEAAEWFLNDGKHFLTGIPDASKSGGLKRMREVFGNPAIITGYSTDIGRDSEWVHLLRRTDPEAILQGLWEADTFPARNLNGYRGGHTGVGAKVSPAADTAPEMYWMDGYLRLSRSSMGVTGIAASAGVKPLQAMLAAAPPNVPHIVHLELGNYRMFLTPEAVKNYPENPVRRAYENYKTPDLQETSFRTPAEVNEAFRGEEAVLRWLMEEFFPANPGSRFVSCKALRNSAVSRTLSTVPAEGIEQAVGDLLARWKQSTHPPEFAQAKGMYYSLTDLFILLAKQCRGETPGRIGQAYGPMEIADDHGPNEGEVEVSAVVTAGAALADRFAGSEWARLPRNSVPVHVNAGGVKLNASQFLKLMAMAQKAGSGGRLPVRLCDMTSTITLGYPTSRPTTECGQTWTVKPAPFSV